MKNTIVFAAAALAAIATPAIAADTPTATVDTSGLDLTKRADQLRLEERVDTAARLICRSGNRDAMSRKLERECRASGEADAAPKIALAIAAARKERFATVHLGPNA
ncbi:UrcA family protein [Qipengyuania sphaerica]|uniref:UrcA family protein n=1 Tax=Qipengyuania sphaerica TaxID=2867243 RepID=UPI001C867DB7|nr:UrcA family protein [Qipengyuania sphaerica]MBX7540741.1 UrcA family protein [Qipengyuania sphaerica]